MPEAAGWAASLRIDYRREEGRSSGHQDSVDGIPAVGRTLAHAQHRGPLRLLKSLYPPGDPAVHQVIVHPPGGIVGGDTLDIALHLGPGSHALLTTPGATRFYRSAGPEAGQSLHAHLADGARLEWLPLETIAYPGCEARNQARFELAPAAEMFGRDVLVLGLPDAGQAFDRGRFGQHLEIPGLWLERGVIKASDHGLLHSPLGLAGRSVSATLWWAAGQPQPAARLEPLLDDARAAIDTLAQADQPLAVLAGVTALHGRMVVLRALGHAVEPTLRLLDAVWARWRLRAWALPAVPPRVWRT